MKKIFTLSLLCVLMFPALLAQNKYDDLLRVKRDSLDYGFYNVVDLKLHNGRFMKNTESLDDIMDNPYFAIDVRVGFQTTGVKQIWDQLYGFPVYGVGFYSIFSDGNELGDPEAVYMFMRAPIFRGERLTWNWELAVGLSYGFQKYDPNTNPDQQVIGSNHNVYFNAATGLSYELSKRFDITLDFDLTHFSNGSTRTPNLGVNLAGFALGGRYSFNPVKNLTKKVDSEYDPPFRPEFVIREIEKYHRHSEIILFGSMGGKTTTTQIYDGPTYFISSFSADYAWAYHHVGMVGAGIDLFYESALRDYPTKIENASFSDLTYSGWHISHYLRMYRLTLVTQLGFYIGDKVSHKGPYYLQVGGSYLVTENFFARVALKTRNGAVADFIEWGLGYQIPFAYAKKDRN